MNVPEDVLQNPPRVHSPCAGNGTVETSTHSPRYLQSNSRPKRADTSTSQTGSQRPACIRLLEGKFYLENAISLQTRTWEASLDRPTLVLFPEQDFHSCPTLWITQILKLTSAMLMKESHDVSRQERHTGLCPITKDSCIPGGTHKKHEVEDTSQAPQQGHHWPPKALGRKGELLQIRSTLKLKLLAT